MDSMLSSARRSLDLAREYAFDIAKPDGHWIGELRSNATMTAEYVFLQQALGRDLSHDREELCRWFFSDQKPNGSWGIAPGDDYPGNLSVSVEAYFALKILGVSIEDKRMLQARDFILSAGRVAAVRIFTRIFLATFGLWPWENIPQLPAELILMPSWAPICIYSFSSWARATIIPLLVICHHMPIYRLPVTEGRTQSKFLNELWRNSSGVSIAYQEPLRNLWGTDWPGFLFATIDVILSYFNGFRSFFLRRYALRKCMSWIYEHQETSGDWGGFIPAMHNGLLALTLEGHSLEDDRFIRALKATERFGWQDRDGKRYQASISPVWDTILMTIGLLDAGVHMEDERLNRAVDWVKNRQLLGPEGDWRIYNPQLVSGGFCFEYDNAWYPDIDDTAAALLAFLKHDSSSASSSVVIRAAKWILGMQNRDGGWGAFDSNNDKLFLNKIPFSDMDALCDPSTADVTGRVLEAFGLLSKISKRRGINVELARHMYFACEQGIEYLTANQELTGAWYGRWSCNYLYGTSNVLCGFEYHAHNPNVRRMVVRALTWLEKVQNEDGGWGEDVDTYIDPQSAGYGTSTPSQTAWALMALLAHLPTTCVATSTGVAYLVQSQTNHGGSGASWPEAKYTGVGFPRHLYIGYQLYRHYFPMMALGRFCKAREDEEAK
ncbi:hypothetical protein P7C71_g3811, partial [Lecanoromycetidae sp. Uapishka_2]